MDVANPPTLLLLVDGILGCVADKQCERVIAEGSRRCSEDDDMRCHATAHSLKCAEEREVGLQFLRKTFPLLDRWAQWYLITQRPGAEGWGGTGSRSPVGAFQVCARLDREMLARTCG